MLHIAFLERKNQKKRFFIPKSMPNFNFAKVQFIIQILLFQHKDTGKLTKKHDQLTEPISI